MAFKYNIACVLSELRYTVFMKQNEADIGPEMFLMTSVVWTNRLYSIHIQQMLWSISPTFYEQFYCQFPFANENKHKL